MKFKKGVIMGGTNEETIGGLRAHIKNSNVHIHDDSKNLKFEMGSSEFRNEIEDALKTLKKSEGIIEIPGDGKNNLCIMRSGRNFSMFLKDNASIKQKLQSFLKDC